MVRYSKQSSNDDDWNTGTRRPSTPVELHMRLLSTPVQPAVLGFVSLLQSTVFFSCYGAGPVQTSNLAAPSVGCAATLPRPPCAEAGSRLCWALGLLPLTVVHQLLNTCSRRTNRRSTTRFLPE